VGVLIAGVLLSGSACSDDDASSAASGGSSTSAEGGSSTPDAGGGTPEGDPIRLGIIVSPNYVDSLEPGAQAAVDRINAEGGVHGRPLEVVICEDGSNANVAATCARQFASDESIVATVGDVSSYGGDYNPPLEQAGVAGIGTTPLSPGDFASPRVFATNSGGLSFLGMGVFLVEELDAQGVGVATLDNPTSQALPDMVGGALAPLGAEVAGVSTVPVTSADVAPQAAALVDTDAQIVGLTEDLSMRYIRSSRQQGFDGPLIVSQTLVNASTLQEGLTDAELEAVYAITWFDKSSDGYAEFLADLEEFQPDAEPTDLETNAWLAVNMFADVASGLDEISRESILEAMSSVSDYDTGGLTPAIDYSEEGTALGGTAPRLVPSALSVYADVYRDGTWAPYAEDQEPINAIS
jgi:branched-chain amino acid transport system substrate-binding protein